MVGKSIAHYTIEEEIGAGGMGTVYRARDTRLDRDVALKVMSGTGRTDPAQNDRFIQEAKAASALDHPNVCTIHEIGESDDGDLFITMAYYEGQTLSDRLKEGPLPHDEALDIAMQISRGLASAHENGITHRDIKPGNIMLTPRGEVKIVDFGLAKLAGNDQLTRTGSTVGTAGYMSPEQLTHGEVDHRSDIFSLGVILYKLFTGVHPFESTYYDATLYAIIYEDPEPVSSVKPELSEELEWIISKTLQKDPAARFQQTSELLEYLLAYADGALKPEHMPTLAPSAAAGNTATPRRRWLLPAAAALILLLGTLLFWNFGTGALQSGLPDSKQIAVLPFRSIGTTPAGQTFADGLFETLTSKLTQLEQFQEQYLVVPASETRSRQISSASEARAAFGVNLVITGSIQQLDRGVRVTINLIDAVTLRQIESKVIDDTFIEQSLLQDNAVFNLAGMLDIELQPEARTILTAGGTTEPGAYEYYLQGLGHLQRFDRREEIQEAITWFERALKEDPEFALAYGALGDANLYLFRRTKDVKWLQQAIKDTEEALLLEDRLSPIHTTLGILQIEQGDYEKALQTLDRALSLDPANFEAYRARARAFMAQERLKEAEGTYLKAIEMKPGYWAGYSELGVFFYRSGRYKEAARQFEIVTQLTPNNAAAYRNLGGVYYYLDRVEEAMEAFRTSVELEPNYGVYSNLGTYYYFEENYDEAAEMYRRALDLNDTDYRVWGFLSNALELTEPPQPGKSMEAKRRALKLAEDHLEINPRDPSLLVSLSYFYQDVGRQEKSFEMLERAVSMRPSELTVIEDIGILYESHGMRDQAIQWITEGVENGLPIANFIQNPDPDLEDLRSDERFTKLVEAYGADGESQ